MMLMGAFVAAVATLMSGSPWVGLLASSLAGMFFALIYGGFAIRFRSNQIVAGTAMNMLAAGMTPFLNKLLYDSTGSSPSLAMEARFQSAPVWIALGATVFCFLCLNYTRFGVWLGVAGEHPQALDTAGVRVNRIRWYAVALSGVLAGLGGASLSIFLSSGFSRGMTAGRGFMALAALIFGKWKPVPTAIACLLFGFADAVQIRLQGVPVFGDQPIPVQFIQILPYGVTILVLAGFVGQSRAPRALGQPF
jgi:simple sugar transport system permease protein